MAKRPDARVVFTDGFVKNREWIVVSSHLVALAEQEYSRVFTFKQGQWWEFDLNAIVRSLCGQQKPVDCIYCLARDGTISVRKRGGAIEERVTDAGSGPGKLGYLSMMREIAGELYVCGVAGQIYRRTSAGWTHFDEGVLDPKGPPKALDLYCIDGSSEKNIFAVGQRSLVWHFNGESWKKQSPPSRLDLNWVRCASNEEAYVCGNNGSFFRVLRDKWDDFSVPGKKENFWCVELFRGEVYLAADDGIFSFDGRRVVPVETGLRPVPDGHRLHANDGVLWSFGVDHLCFFDGKKWTYVKHPDNP